jgi:hypothetical protein
LNWAKGLADEPVLIFVYMVYKLNSEKRAVEAIMGMLESPVKAWHCAAAELVGRLIVNPDNEPFVLPFAPQVDLVKLSPHWRFASSRFWFLMADYMVHLYIHGRCISS